MAKEKARQMPGFFFYVLRRLNNQQRIAVAQETVAFFYRQVIDVHRQVVARKGASQHQHRALRTVEIGN